MHRIVLVYALAYLGLTATDILSTLWATGGSAGVEFNASVADGSGGMHVGRMIAINLAMLIFTSGMLEWALRQRHRIDPRYLERPERALFNWLYLNPFAPKRVPVSALHYLALAPTMLGMKLLASANNSLIGAGIPDLVTPLAHAVTRVLPGTAGYWAVIFILFMPFWWLSLRLVAQWLRADRASAGLAIAAA
jgi:hypothetical protein